MSAILTHHAFGSAGRSRRVEDIEWIVRGQLGAGRNGIGRSRGAQLHPVALTRCQLGGQALTLEHHHVAHLVRGKLQRLVDHRLVGYGPRAFDPAAGGQQHLGRGIVDPLGQFERSEAAEHHRMDRPQPGAGQHGEDGFRDHRHIDDHPVALAYAQAGQHRRDPADFRVQFGIGETPDRIGHRAVIGERDLVPPPGANMPVDAVVSGVERTTRKPAALLVISLYRCRDPVDRFGRAQPEPFAVRDAFAPGGLISFAH